MKRLDTLVIGAQVKAGKAVEKLLTKKENGDSQVVVALVLVAVAVGLCVVFQDAIRGLLNNLINSVQGKVNNLVNLK